MLKTEISLFTTLVSFLLVCIICSGCTNERQYKIVPPEETIENTSINEADFHEVCKRIEKLNVTVVSPGSGIDHEQLQMAKKIIGKYNIDIPEAALKSLFEIGCSDTKENRLVAFTKAVKSNRSIVWAIRGGCGTETIITDLNKLPIPKTKKTFIGFCDSTSMNIFLTQKWNWKVIHAPVFIYLLGKGFSKEKFDTLLNILENKIDSYDISNLRPLNVLAKSCKSVSGPLTGGNLTLVEASFGTCWEIQTDGKILFLEDAHEKPLSIYRSLYHLKDSGKLAGVKAILLGTFLDGGPQNIIQYVLKKFSQQVKVPVFITDQFGHGHQNMPLIYNAIATISDNKMTVKI